MTKVTGFVIIARINGLAKYQGWQKSRFFEKKLKNQFF